MNIQLDMNLISNTLMIALACVVVCAIIMASIVALILVYKTLQFLFSFTVFLCEYLYCKTMKRKKFLEDTANPQAAAEERPEP